MERRTPSGSRRDDGGRGGAGADNDQLGRAVWVRLVVFVVVVAAAAVVGLLVGSPDVGSLRGGVAAAGPAAPALFVLLYALAALLPLPKNILAAVAGALFGLVSGVVLDCSPRCSAR